MSVSIRPLGRTGAVAVFTVLTVTVLSQELPRPSYQTGVALVIVDVTVLERDGAPVADLAADDFTLTVDGTPRTIVSSRLIHSDTRGPAPSSPGPSPDTRPGPPRRFVMALDRDHMPAGEGQQMLDAAARFVEGLPPGDVVAAWRLDTPSTTLRFLADRAALGATIRQSVGTFRPPSSRFVIARDEALAIDEGDREMLDSVLVRECARMPASCPVEVETDARQIALDARQRAERSLAGLATLARALGSLEGPKHIVLVSGGPASTAAARGMLARITADAASSRVTIHALQVADTMLQTDSLRPLPRRIDQTQSAAYALATATGGLALTPTSGEIGFGQLTRQLSAGYELTFEPTPADRDGREHRIEVRVDGRGFGTQVRARRTFRIDPALVTAAPASDTPPASARPSGSVPPETAPDVPAAPAPAGTDLPPGAGPVDVASLTIALARYATRFEQTFSGIVAEERYVQIVHPWRGTPREPEREPALTWRDAEHAPTAGGPIIARRQLVSDVLLVQLPNGEWLGYRDVAVVDGRPVRDRTERVRDLFLNPSGQARTQLSAIADESARYNLGNRRRNMNVPTLALGFMRPADQWRFAFRRQKDESVGGRPTRVLSFKETARPTLIGGRNRRDIPIEGRLWLDAITGAVWRTEMRFDTSGQSRNYVRTEYGPHPGEDILIPVRMWEWYEGVDMTGRIGGDTSAVQCLATYGTFRRFQVSTSEAVK